MCYEKIGNCVLVNGDCRDVLESLPAIGAVVTDPPYGILLRSRPGENTRNYPITGDDFPISVFPVLNWAARKQLPLIVFASPQQPWPGEWRNLIVWDKGEGVGGGGDTKKCLKRTWELIQVARNDPINTSRCGSVWEHKSSIHQTKNHIAAKPVSLMERLIQTFCKGLIFDPFMGAGSTGVACVNLGHRFIGVEIGEHHFETACQRIREAHEATVPEAA